jgi:hypothetical protein
MEIADVECGQDEEDRGEARQGRIRERIGCGVVGLRHGSKSLALSVYLGMVDVGGSGGGEGKSRSLALLGMTFQEGLLIVLNGYELQL